MADEGLEEKAKPDPTSTGLTVTQSDNKNESDEDEAPVPIRLELPGLSFSYKESTEVETLTKQMHSSLVLSGMNESTESKVLDTASLQMDVDLSNSLLFHPNLYNLIMGGGEKPYFDPNSAKMNAWRGAALELDKKSAKQARMIKLMPCPSQIANNRTFALGSRHNPEIYAHLDLSEISQASCTASASVATFVCSPTAAAMAEAVQSRVPAEPQVLLPNLNQDHVPALSEGTSSGSIARALVASIAAEDQQPDSPTLSMISEEPGTSLEEPKEEIDPAPNESNGSATGEMTQASMKSLAIPLVAGPLVASRKRDRSLEAAQEENSAKSVAAGSTALVPAHTAAVVNWPIKSHILPLEKKRQRDDEREDDEDVHNGGTVVDEEGIVDDASKKPRLTDLTAVDTEAMGTIAEFLLIKDSSIFEECWNYNTDEDIDDL
jgi:hypothetical protein